jgi:hypothetical protein
MLKEYCVTRAFLEEFNDEKDLSTSQNGSLLLELIKVWFKILYLVTQIIFLKEDWLETLMYSSNKPFFLLLLQFPFKIASNKVRNTCGVYMESIEENDNVWGRLDHMDSTLCSLLYKRPIWGVTSRKWVIVEHVPSSFWNTKSVRKLAILVLSNGLSLKSLIR